MATAEKTINSIDELKAMIGQEMGVSEWVEMTQDRVNQFADVTGDHQWIHVDIERAKASPLGGPIAHGFLTLSMLQCCVSRAGRAYASISVPRWPSITA